ncbi:MAG TPA: FtsQ-type POTRA domain-containing protein [Candidatus Elarobacter sp.]
MPRRRKPSLAARVRPFWIFLVILAVLCAWGGAWLVQSPWFRVARVGIDLPLAAPVSRDDVRRAAAIAPGANVWLLNTGAMRRRIEAIPYIDRASVHRGQFPQPFVELTATVRRPTACVRAGNREVTIDATSRVLQNGCARESAAIIAAGPAKVPAPGGTIADRDITRLLADAKTLSDADVAVRSLGRDRWGGLEAVDVTGVILRFGDDADLDKKAALVQPVRAGIGTRRVVRAIDLRAPGTPVVVYR